MDKMVLQVVDDGEQDTGAPAEHEDASDGFNRTQYTPGNRRYDIAKTNRGVAGGGIIKRGAEIREAAGQIITCGPHGDLQ